MHLGTPAHLDLPHAEVEEGHAFADLDDTLGSDAAHGGAETTVELQNGELVEDCRILALGQVVVRHDLTLGGRVDTVPLAARAGSNDRDCGGADIPDAQLLSLCLLAEVSVEEEEEGLHLFLE
jgi:hypothetical protein